MSPSQDRRDPLKRDHAEAKRRTGNTNLWLLLLVLAGLQFGYPITFYGELWTGLYMLAYAAMILFGIRVVRQENTPTRPFFVLAVVMASAGLWFSLDQGNVVAQVSMLTTVGVFQLALLISLFRFIVLLGRHVTGTQLILAALSAYLLLGGVFAVAFNLVETATPGSFVDNAVPDRPLVWQGLLYASYVTLATLGYGEVLAISPWARSLVTLEAISGTLFIAIVIARLVGAAATEWDQKQGR